MPLFHLFYEGIIYEQTKGTTMGSSLSLIVENIFMEHFEARALNSWHHKPKCWFIFVDDIFLFGRMDFKPSIAFSTILITFSSIFNSLWKYNPTILFLFLMFLSLYCLMTPLPTNFIERRLILNFIFMPILITTLPKNQVSLRHLSPMPLKYLLPSSLPQTNPT